MFEKKLNSINLGKKTKQIIREYTGKSRLSVQQYYEAIDKYNDEVDKRKKEAKKQIKPLSVLPSYIEQNQAELKISRKTFQEERKQYQKQKRENNPKVMFIRNIKEISNGNQDNYRMKILPFMRQFKNPIIGFQFLLKKIKDELINNGKKVDIVFNGKYYALNNNTYKKLINEIISNNVSSVIEQHTNSDAEFLGYVINASNNDEIEISVFKITYIHNLNQGDFFKYYHNTIYDLTRYGIHSNKPKSYPNNCLIEALQYAGLEPHLLNTAKLMMNCKHFPVCRIEQLANELNIRINLKIMESKQSRKKIFGKNGNVYNICLYDEHYFVDEKTNITRFCLENYEAVKDIENSNNIKCLTPRLKRDNSRFIDSWDLVLILLENKQSLLRPIPTSDLFDSQYYDKVEEDFTNLTYTENNVKEVEKKQGKEKEAKIVFFDFETISKEHHIPYLCCILNNEIKTSFIGSDCGLQMLKFLSYKYKSVLLIAHNASYDYRFILQYLNRVEEISAGTSIYSINGYFNKLSVIVKDSYKLIPMALKNFPKTFKLQNTVKEVISYKFYNETNAVDERFMSIELAEEYLRNENKDIHQFRDNLIKWKLINKDKFDAIEYSRKYCEIDCEILMNGYNTFKNWILQLTGMNIDNILTVASLSHQYFINEGCYEGVYELSGIPRAFIQKCVVGGRVMTNNNKKCKNNTGKYINDFDAVSLYPSAMSRIDGYLKGKPQILDTYDYNIIKNYSGYFVEIVIKKVGIKRDFPLMSFKNKDGIRVFSNQMVNKHIYVDKIYLEDLIEFHNIEFDIIRGYYFNDGYNTKINTVIKTVFNERLRLKKEGNPAETVYKLIMNSGYGKSIMKPHTEKIRFFNNKEQMNTFKSRNYDWVITAEQINNCDLWRLKSIEPLSNHFNIAHIGVSILSMSKRIMNEVMCSAEDNDIKMFYQDTDSIHLFNEDISKLSKIYNDKYGRELIGKQMGQFHSDFDLKDCEDVKASRSIFLGKKCYIDELEGIDKDGNIKTGFHIRLKGVPNTTILHTANKMGISVYQLYEKLYDGEKIKFDLTEDGKKDNFKFHTNGLISTLLQFKREISF